MKKALSAIRHLLWSIRYAYDPQEKRFESLEGEIPF